jgi:hypothetical protein
MLNFNKNNAFRGKITHYPSKTARKSTNFKETTISFVFFFEKIKIEKERMNYL